MATRAADWFRQAEADLAYARHALQPGDHEAERAIADAEAVLECCR